MESIFVAQKTFKANLGLQKVKAVANKNYQRHGTKSYVSLLHRYGFNPTLPGPYYHASSVHQSGKSTIKNALGGRAHKDRVLVKKTGSGDAAKEGRVTAEDIQNDSMYLCEVSIGTPAQTFKLDFDTGSADLWVCSTELKGSTSGHSLFDPTKSDTFKKLSKAAWEISYGDGSTASGDCGKDTVNIGGLSIEGQVIELAKKLSTQFANSSGDGLLELAFSKINTVTFSGDADPQATPVENMIAQGDIPKTSELFTSAFYSDRDSSAPNSFYTFGYIEEDLVGDDADIHWTPVDNTQGFWMVPSESYSIAGKTVTASGNTAIVDTGTTLALLSDEVVKALYDTIPKAKYDSTQQGYVFPKDTSTDDLPVFSIAVGDKKFVINKADLAFADLDDGSGNVYGGIQSRGTMTFDILGDVFLKCIYAIWDQGEMRFGAVPKK